MDKICTKCGESKNVSEFTFDKTHNGYHAKCKICKALYAKQYRLQNKEKSAACVKKSRNKKREEHLAKKRAESKKHYAKNKDKIILRRKPRNKILAKKHRKTLRKKRLSNPETASIFKLRENISRSIRSALFKNHSSKNNNSIINYLPYTIQELKTHIELQWEDWMNWDNYGVYKKNGERKWHIDHIYPQSKLPYDTMQHPNFLKSWCLSNLRPLEAMANIIKKDKIISEAA